MDPDLTVNATYMQLDLKCTRNRRKKIQGLLVLAREERREVRNQIKSSNPGPCLPSIMVVKLLFGGNSRKRDAATSNANSKASVPRGGGVGAGGGPAIVKAGARRGTTASKSNSKSPFSGQRGPSVHPKKAGATPPISLVSTNKNPTPPTVSTYPYYDDDCNNLSASSSTMLLQLQVHHHRHCNLDDSFEVLIAESQQGMWQKQKQGQQLDEVAIRKKLFASPGPDHAGGRRHHEDSKEIAGSTSTSSTASSRSSPQVSSPKQQVQFFRFRSSPQASKTVEESKDASIRQTATKLAPAMNTRIIVNKVDSSPTGIRSSAEAAPSVGNATAQMASPQPLETAAPSVEASSQIQPEKTSVVPGSIPLTLPASRTRKPPRAPSGGSSSMRAAVGAAASCAIPTPNKPFRSHMGSFDTLDTTMSPILKQDPNFSLDTTQTAANLGGLEEPTTKSLAGGTDSPASTALWMEQWQSFKHKVSLAIDSCQPGASQLAQRSENLFLDLFYDTSNPLWRCIDQSTFVDPRRPVYNEEVTMEFLHLMMTTGITVLHMQPPQTPLNPALDWKGQSVVMIVEPGGGGGSVIGGGEDGSWVPRLEWTTVAGGQHFEVSTSGLSILEILSIRSREVEEEEDEGLTDEDDETNPSTDDDRRFGHGDNSKSRRSRRSALSEHGSLASTTVEDEVPAADFSSFFTITSTSGDVYVFEAASVYDRDRIIQGLRNVIAWLSYATVMGDTTASSILFSEPAHRGGDGDEPAELPMLAKQPYRIAMNRTAHVLLDE
jgi:hypothetical protein